MQYSPSHYLASDGGQQHLAPPTPLSAFPRRPSSIDCYPAPLASCSGAIEAMLDAIEDHVHALSEYIQEVHGGNPENSLDPRLTRRIALSSMQLSRLITGPRPSPPGPQRPMAVVVNCHSPAAMMPAVPHGYVRVPVYRVHPGSATWHHRVALESPQMSQEHDSYQPSLAPSDAAVVETPSSASVASQSPPPTPLPPFSDHELHASLVLARLSSSPQGTGPGRHTSQHLPPLASVLGSYMQPQTSAAPSGPRPASPTAGPAKILTPPSFKRKLKHRPPPLQSLASYLAIGPQRTGGTMGHHKGQVSR